MSLRERLTALISANGPMSISAFMDLCLHDPRSGYYATRPGLGVTGDFITAPHVSQMFGELIGLWAAEAWTRLGRPSRVNLIELGPGDGTMITDMLRAARAVPDFIAACDIWLVETSPPLRAMQRTALRDLAARVRWVERLQDVPNGAPAVLVANEFLDCLPVDQFVRGPKGWMERRVGLDAAGGLCFHTLPPDPERGLPTARTPLIPRKGQAGSPRSDLHAAEGSVLETSAALAEFAGVVAGLIARTGGMALFIDYGRDAEGFGDTLQALRGHAKEHPLANPGEADLTAHVDFPRFLAAARRRGAMTSAIRTQGAFLRDLGIEARAAALAGANPDRSAIIDRQLRLLIDPGQMGTLFKAACMHAPGSP